MKNLLRPLQEALATNSSRRSYRQQRDVAKQASKTAQETILWMRPTLESLADTSGSIRAINGVTFVRQRSTYFDTLMGGILSVAYGFTVPTIFLHARITSRLRARFRRIGDPRRSLGRLKRSIGSNGPIISGAPSSKTPNIGASFAMEAVPRTDTKQGKEPTKKLIEWSQNWISYSTIMRHVFDALGAVSGSPWRFRHRCSFGGKARYSLMLSSHDDQSRTENANTLKFRCILAYQGGKDRLSYEFNARHSRHFDSGAGNFHCPSPRRDHLLNNKSQPASPTGVRIFNWSLLFLF